MKAYEIAGNSSQTITCNGASGACKLQQSPESMVVENTHVTGIWPFRSIAKDKNNLFAFFIKSAFVIHSQICGQLLHYFVHLFLHNRLYIQCPSLPHQHICSTSLLHQAASD